MTESNGANGNLALPPSNGVRRNDLDDDSTSYSEKCPNLCDMFSRKFKSKSCGELTKNFIYARLPFLSWITKYGREEFIGDMVAGLTVGLTVIPQGIAYAIVAGLEPQYGLYAAFMGSFVYIFMGTCSATTIGPTAIMALMVSTTTSRLGPDFAILLGFLTGCIVFLAGALNLGFLVQYISTPVITGFTTAAALTIASGQIKGLLGLPGSSNEFMDAWENIFKNIQRLHMWDTILGVTCMLILYGLKRLGTAKGPLKGVWKGLSLSRNAIVVFSCTLLAYLLRLGDLEPFHLTGEIGSGLPPFKPPPFSTNFNGTDLGFGDMLSELGASIFTIPLICIIEAITIATIFCKKTETVDGTQEMLAVGTCNIIASFFASMPITGSFSRSAVNHSSGVRTPMSGFWTGALVLLALGLLTNTFYYIPKTTLAAVIISAVLPMVEIHAIMETWRTRKMDLFPLFVTLIACLFIGLEYGILIGVAANLLFILYDSARPKVDISTLMIGGHDVLLAQPNESLIFASADYFWSLIAKAVVKNPSVNTVVLCGEYVSKVDFTGVKKISALIESLRSQDKVVVLWNWKIETRNLFLRYNKDYRDIFMYNERLDDVIFQLKLTSNDAKLTTMIVQ